jgi:hypothetical protein
VPVHFFINPASSIHSGSSSPILSVQYPRFPSKLATIRAFTLLHMCHICANSTKVNTFGTVGGRAGLLLVIAILFVSVFSRAAPEHVACRSGYGGLDVSLEAVRFRTNCTNLPTTASSSFSLMEHTKVFKVVSIK